MLLIAAGHEWMQRDIDHPPGMLAAADPVQTATTASGAPVSHGEFQLRRRAGFEVTARVLSTRRYRWGLGADLSPIDLALGWGPMSDQSVLDRLDISQGNRWYFFRYENPPPLAPGDLSTHSANMHMIPAEPWVEDELLDLRHGDVVSLSGYLVDAQHPTGFKWRTSLSREDTGGGACELFLVTGITIKPRP